MSVLARYCTWIQQGSYAKELLAVVIGSVAPMRIALRVVCGRLDGGASAAVLRDDMGDKQGVVVERPTTASPVALPRGASRVLELHT